MPDSSPPHRRRVRYAGTHPRRFEDKYKELDPSIEQHDLEIQKAIARGQTPAGMHRSICVEEILGILNPQPGETGLDATLGFGGHAQTLIPRTQPGGRLFGIDVDPIELPRTTLRLRALGFDESMLIVRHENFCKVNELLPLTRGGFDFVLADLGVSSMQIDNPSRGFSFRASGPLDLRLDPGGGQTASSLLQSVTRQRLRDILIDHADEPFAIPLAAALQGQYIETTTQLAELIRATVESALKPNVSLDERTSEKKKAVQRTFQALRIEINNEYGVLDLFLSQLPGCLKAGARVAILSFHSGEDRRVKKSFQTGFRDGTYSRVADDPLRASFDERHTNPRSSSAKLRWAVKS